MGEKGQTSWDEVIGRCHEDNIHLLGSKIPVPGMLQMNDLTQGGSRAEVRE